MNGLMTVTHSTKERVSRLYTALHGMWDHDVQTNMASFKLHELFFNNNTYNANLESLVMNRDISIPNGEIGRFSLFCEQSGDLLPPNRETWKLCTVRGHLYAT